MRRTALAALLLCLPATAMANTIVVQPGNPDWTFGNDGKGSNASGAFVTGPTTPPLGTGSAEFTVNDSGSAEALSNATLDNGMSVSDFTGLSYSTYRTTPSGNAEEMVSLQIKVTVGGSTSQHNFVFEPYQLPNAQGTLLPSGAWQTWDALAGYWWYSGASYSGTCGMGKACTWSELLAAYPDTKVTGGLMLKAGSGWSSFDGNVDDLTVATASGGSTTYDFEPVPEPASIALFGTAVLMLGMVSLRRKA